MYKMYNGLHPPTINNMYIKNSDVHNHNTRHKNYLHVSMAHGDLYAKSFYCSSILIWNDLRQLFPRYEGQLTRMAEPKPILSAPSYTLTTSHH